MIWTEEDLKSFTGSKELAMLFFMTHGCGVCHTQVQRVEALSDKLSIPLRVVEMSDNQHLVASQMVLNVPVTKVFKDGNEVFKQGAYMDLQRLEDFLSTLKEST
jgi:thiol-disulfide isomerase/thioredoxin